MNLVTAPFAPFSVLLADLPSLVRLELGKLLRPEVNVRVVANTNGANELLLEARRCRPDLIIVGEHRLLTLQQLAAHCCAPVLLYAATPPWPGTMREAAQWGVYDHISPVPAAAHPDYQRYQLELLGKVRRVARRPGTVSVAASSLQRPIIVPPQGVIVIGGSTGSATAVEQIVSRLKPGLNYAVVVAVHLPAAFTATLVERIRRASVLPVLEGGAGVRLQAGTVVIAPGGRNVVVRSTATAGWQLGWAAEPVTGLDEPNIDLLMRSAARTAGRHAVGVVLSGLGHDGTVGAQHIRQNGGSVVVQNAESAAMFSMPHSVIQAGFANASLPLAGIGNYLNSLAQKPVSTPVAGRGVPVIRPAC